MPFKPFIKKKLKPKTVAKAKDQDHIRRNKLRLNKVVENSSGDLVETKRSWFGRGDITKTWTPKGVRKKVSVTDSEGNPLREIEFDSQGDIRSQLIRYRKRRQKTAKKQK